jgi:alkylated DNA repair dioxygenase AlkB
MCEGELRWQATPEAALIYAGTKLLAEPRISARGQWYDADFNDAEVLYKATALARDFCPSNVRQTLTLKAGDFQFHASGKIKFDSKKSTLTVSKLLEIPIAGRATVSEKLDINGFRAWLTSASMEFRLPRPPTLAKSPVRSHWVSSESVVDRAPKAKIRSAIMSKKAENSFTPPLGLSIIENFITEDSERDLLEAIDGLPWNAAMSRRVQHHGWRYDYKAKKVDPATYLGPLPGWASNLAERLLEGGFVPEMPDQVIVNEYIAMQGISKHIDCPSCFRGPVVTISLGETWEMVFSRQGESGAEEKYRVMLPRRSAVVLDGESRSLWSHEIAKKKSDNGHPRNRRVSITFRKVAIQR